MAGGTNAEQISAKTLDLAERQLRYLVDKLEESGAFVYQSPGLTVFSIIVNTEKGEARTSIMKFEP